MKSHLQSSASLWVGQRFRIGRLRGAGARMGRHGMPEGAYKQQRHRTTTEAMRSLDGGCCLGMTRIVRDLASSVRLFVRSHRSAALLTGMGDLVRPPSTAPDST